MPPLFVNPRNLAQLARPAYITVSEYKAAPTAVDTDTLFAGANAPQEDDALATVIARASSWIDGHCHQILAATSDTETDLVRINSSGYVPLVCRRFPILEVDSVLLGPTPSTMVAVDATAGLDIWLDQERIIYCPVRSVSTVAGPSFRSTSSVGGKLQAQWVYVNGHPHTTLSGTAGTTIAAGATTLTVNSTTGMYAGTPLTVYDTTYRAETVTVAAAGATSSTVIPLVTPTLYPHTIPNAPDAITVSALPHRVKQAAILLTSALIKTRGNESIVMASIGGSPHSVTDAYAGATEDIDDAFELLSSFRVVR